jgi:hypothetical protein
MRKFPSVAAAALSIGALSFAVVGFASAGIVRVGVPQQRQITPYAGLHWNNGMLMATPHYMRTARAGVRVRPDFGLSYGGGYTQHPPHVLLTYWGWTTDPSGEKPYLRRFLRGVGGSAWLGVVTQYYGPPGHFITNPVGQLIGIWNDTSAIPSSPSDAQIAAEAVKAAAHFNKINKNISYVIATPTGHSSSGFGSSFCAYHGKVSDNGTLLAYTNLPYMTDAGSSCGADFVNPPPGGNLDGVSIVEGHELAETQTDPDYFSGWYSGSLGEIGDACAWQNLGNTTLSTGTFAVQPLWSNAVSGCVRN